jgi:hypothetical protein
VRLADSREGSQGRVEIETQLPDQRCDVAHSSWSRTVMHVPYNPKHAAQGTHGGTGLSSPRQVLIELSMKTIV